MKRALTLCAAVLCLTMALAPTALAAGTDAVEVCYADQGINSFAK